MALEGPIGMSVIGMAPDQLLNAAAYLVMMTLAFFFESPVIDLLSTSTTMGTSYARYRSLTKFAWLFVFWVTFTHGLVAFTPIYDWITVSLMRIQPDVAEAGRIPFMIMTPFSACVGWRRYLHGIMIRQGQTKPITVGTLCRVIAMALVGFSVVTFTNFSGLMAAAMGITGAVFSEAVFIHIVSRKVIRELPRDGDGEISFRKLFAFHLPLTGSSMVMMVSPSLVTAALANSDSPIISMAAWQTAISVIWFFRAATYALPEAVMSLYSPGKIGEMIFRYCFSTGLILTGLMILIHFLQVDFLIFRKLYTAEPVIAKMAGLAFLACAFTPLVNAMASYVRGVLTSYHITWARLLAIGFGISSLLLFLNLLLRTRLEGVVVVGLSLTFSLAVEIIVQAISLRLWLKRQIPPEFEPCVQDVA